MSFTGNFMDAEEALRFGLVNHVVPHDELIPFTRQLAADIGDNEPDGVRQIRATYNEIAMHDRDWETESRDESRVAPYPVQPGQGRRATRTDPVPRQDSVT